MSVPDEYINPPLARADCGHVVTGCRERALDGEACDTLCCGCELSSGCPRCRKERKLLERAEELMAAIREDLRLSVESYLAKSHRSQHQGRLDDLFQLMDALPIRAEDCE